METPFESIVEGFNALSPAVQTALVALVAAQLVLAVVAIVVLLRTPAERLVFGKRWVWVLIIMLGEMLGPVAFFAFGRKPVVAPEQSAGVQPPAMPPGSDADGHSNADRMADLLYGEGPGVSAHRPADASGASDSSGGRP